MTRRRQRSGPPPDPAKARRVGPWQSMGLPWAADRSRKQLCEVARTTRRDDACSRPECVLAPAVTELRLIVLRIRTHAASPGVSGSWTIRVTLHFGGLGLIRSFLVRAASKARERKDARRLSAQRKWAVLTLSNAVGPLTLKADARPYCYS